MQRKKDKKISFQWHLKLLTLDKYFSIKYRRTKVHISLQYFSMLFISFDVCILKQGLGITCRYLPKHANPTSRGDERQDSLRITDKRFICFSLMTNSNITYMNVMNVYMNTILLGLIQEDEPKKAFIDYRRTGIFLNGKCL